jgi:uncharacterized protein YecE (DUF72 family)
MRKWWIGCSGFYYKGWKEKFYPADLPQRKWFEFYCESFNTVELNVTFYRFPKLRDLEGWHERSPDEFRFTVKAPRLITHYKKFINVKRELGDFYDTVNKGLREKLGCVLFQLHPAIAYSEENLERIIESLDKRFINAIEFRHASWWTDKVYKVLKDHKITFCSISYPGLPDMVIKTAPTVYYRFHGVPKLYLSSYSSRKLTSIQADIKKFRGTENVFAYFNNDIEVAAVDNAKKLKQLARGR